MLLSVTFQYPSWFLLFCLLFGLLYAFILYYKDKTFKDATPRLRRMLAAIAVLRFVTVSLLAFFLLSPLIQSRFTEIEKPLIIVAQDNSESIGSSFAEKDSAAYAAGVNELVRSLEKNYSVQKISFGGKVKEEIDFKFNEKITNLSEAFDYIYHSFSNRNVGAVILASDGLYNSGTNPVYAEKKLPVPVYSIALGDTAEKKDLVLSRVYYNQVAYLGDKFVLKMDVSAKNCNAEQTLLSVSQVEPQQVVSLQKKNIAVKGNSFDTSVAVVLDADKSGIQRYRISLSPVKDEITTANNVQDIFIEVLDSRQKILLLANAPHPDISALKQAIEYNKNYELKLEYANRIGSGFSVKEFNLVILHQLPSKTNNIKPVYEKLVQANVPVLFILGSQSAIALFNGYQPVLQIAGKSFMVNEVQAVAQKDFTLFSLSDALVQSVKNFPPLQVPYGEYKVAANSQILLSQKIGAVETKNPLLVFNQGIGSKAGVLCGEGFWKWRLHDFMQHKNHDATNELISRVLQFLSVKADKRQFRVILPKNNFDENEPITMDAELYDESYQLTNIPDVDLKITDSEAKEFPYVFSKTEKGYTLNAGYFPVGNYHYHAKTKFNNKELAAKGEFSISPVQLESLQTTANHPLLYSLSEASGGKVFSSQELHQISEEIAKQESIKPVSYATRKTSSLINLKWLFFLLLALLSVEWFTRKWNGAY